jgi:hypothetical protein
LADGLVRLLRRLPPEIFATWSQAEPGAEVFFCGPTTHVESNLTDDGQSRVSFDAIDLGEINAGHAIKIAAGIEGHPAATALARTGSDRSLGALLLELLEASLDLPVTGADLALVKVDEFDSLLERKQMLFTIVSFEGARHSGLGTFAAWVAKFGQFDRIALTAKDGLYDPPYLSAQ